MLFIPQLEFEYKMNEANICVCGCDLGPVGLADGDHAEGPQPPHNWRPGPASHRIYTHTGDRHLLREAALNIKIQDQFTHICMILNGHAVLNVTCFLYLFIFTRWMECAVVKVIPF